MEPPNLPPLRIALLGADHATPAIARAIAASRRFELVGVCEFDEAPGSEVVASPTEILGRVKRLDSWEALLDSRAVDAVVVARGPDEDRRAEQLRKLIQTSVPVMASHPVFDSMLIYYELDMIRRETGSVVIPCLGQRHHPAIESLAAMTRGGAESPIGRVEQVLVQRLIARPTKSAVVAQFARDVDLVRHIAGDMTRLGAMAGGDGESAYGSRGVQMSGPSGVAARWSVVPSPAEGAQITLVGSAGKATVEMRPEGEPWTVELTAGGQSSSQPCESWDPAAAALAELAGAIRGEPAEPDWVDAARSVELAETIARSLHKGRTIELYYEDYTEEGTFKGTMTSVGCGLLLLGLAVVGIVAIAEQIGVPHMSGWPYVLVGVMGVFLALQLLMFASRKPAAPDGDTLPPGEQSARR